MAIFPRFPGTLTRGVERRRLLVVAAAASILAIVAAIASMRISLDAGSASIAPVLIVLIALTVFGLPIALRHPDVAVLSLVVVDLTRLSDLTADIIGVGVFQPLLLLSVASLCLALVQGRLRLHWSPFYLLILVMLAVMAGSAMVAGFSDDAMAALVEAAKDFVYFAVVLVWVGSSRSPRLATNVLVFTVASLAALTVLQEFVFGNSFDFFGLSNIETTQLGAVTLRHSGPESDANFWARSLVVVLPLALSSWALAVRRPVRWIVGGASVSIAAGIYLTQSRGGIIAAVAGITVWLIMAGRRYARLLVIAPLVFALLLVIPGVGSRLVTLSEVTVAGQGSGDPSLQGRIGAQRSGVSMFLEHPVTGIGFGEFRQTVPEYQRKLGIQAEVLDAHNLYLEIAAETGAIGLLGWGLFLGFGLFVGLRAWLVTRRSSSPDDRWIRMMAAGVIAGLVGWLVASVFLHAASLRVLYTVLAIAAGLDLTAGRDRRPEASAPSGSVGADSVPDPQAATSVPRDRSWRRAGAAALAIVASFTVFGLCAWAVVRMAPERWIVERHLVVAASEDADVRYTAYTYDLITRDLVGATYAAVLEEPEIARRVGARLGWSDETLSSMRVGVSYSSASQVMTVRAEGGDPQAARDLAEAVIDVGSEYVRGLRQPFSLEAVELDSDGVQRSAALGALPLALLGVLASALMVAVWLFVRRPPTVPHRGSPPAPARPVAAPHRHDAVRTHDAVEHVPEVGVTGSGHEHRAAPSNASGVAIDDAGGGTGERGTDRIDLNTATVADLVAIPGVGRFLASRIVAYRDHHGPFASAEDLLHVRGLGRGKMETIRGFISSD